ncbi:hypothetical protein [Acinetobacter johnsonii]|uniref:Uncharacterized protein n=1 Tax=Acinetobacter johnsonii TaxID=40214 RepID=A0AAW6RRG9_ACIJO|nr:hypothetical protein [Acinetobacter johnsonii]MDG9785894.1 hypothetical protein [Acinetobacter johnsonii]MDG9797847.1 hypothetical protein [Acinetobacter johnsonii]
MNAKLEIVAIEQPEIIEAFKVEGGTRALFERVSENARSVVFDMGVKKDRESLKSFAYSLARIKTTVDNHGKELVSGIKQQAAVIDADRKFWRDNMELLQEEIRKPLTDFEQAEKDRVAKHEGAIRAVRSLYGENTKNQEVHVIKGYIFDLEKHEIDSSYEEYEEQAKLAKFETLEVLRKALGVREKFEAEQAELERLRIAEQQRIQQEREAQIAREAAEKATREAEEKARFEAERVQREKLEAEQREARLKAEKEAAELRAQQAAENERKRIEAEQFAQAEAARKAEEARLANVEHRKQICSEALKGLTDLGLSVDQGKAVLNAINKGLVPHVSIKF